MRIRSVRWIVAVATVGALVAGCSDDGGGDQADDAGASETTPSLEPDLAAYCDAELAMETVPEPEIDYATATPEEEAEGRRAYGRETLQPLADDVVATAPEELAADAEVVSSAIDELAESGDFAVLEQPEVEAARDNLHAFDLDNCRWSTRHVTARESLYAGLPRELDAGPTSFELVNEGQDLHELVLVRKNDGVTASVEELLEMPEEQSLSQVTEIGSALAAQGENDHLVADLEPGDYIGACFVTAGTTSEEAPPPTQGMPHSALGMVLEFTVS
jgi:hypothetical protein